MFVNVLRRPDQTSLITSSSSFYQRISFNMNEFLKIITQHCSQIEGDQANKFNQVGLSSVALIEY